MPSDSVLPNINYFIIILAILSIQQFLYRAIHCHFETRIHVVGETGYASENRLRY
jgi:hypothetical protein